MITRIAIHVLTCPIVFALVGCRDKPEPQVDVTKQQLMTPPPKVEERSLGTRVQPTLVKQGQLPLVYLNEEPQTLRFVDLTANRDLGSAKVGARQIVSFEAIRGVVIANNPAIPATLDASHRYGIYVEPRQESLSRQETGQIAPPPRPKPPSQQQDPPASQPAATQPSSR